MLYYEMMLHGDDGVLNAHVTVLRNPRFDSVVDRVFGSDDCKVALDVLRAIPVNMALVSVYYPMLDRRVIINSNPFGGNMDLSHMLDKQESTKSSVDLPTRLIAPLPNVVPDDKFISYAQVTDIASIQAAPSNSVLLFSEQDFELLEVLVDHPLLFGFNTMVLSGLPGADYGAQFESRTYKQERVAYAAFVNEVIEFQRAEAAVKDETQSNYERERSQYTRANGSVKGFTKHVMAGLADATEPDDDGE